jgi:hypothetical protein
VTLSSVLSLCHTVLLLRSILCRAVLRSVPTLPHQPHPLPTVHSQSRRCPTRCTTTHRRSPRCPRPILRSVARNRFNPPNSNLDWGHRRHSTQWRPLHITSVSGGPPPLHQIWVPDVEIWGWASHPCYSRVSVLRGKVSKPVDDVRHVSNFPSKYETWVFSFILCTDQQQPSLVNYSSLLLGRYDGWIVCQLVIDLNGWGKRDI